MGLRTLGSWESSGRDETSREAVSDCVGKLFPVLGLRKVDGNLGWSRARGRGRGLRGPAHSGGCGELGEGMPGLFVLSSRWLGD